MPTTHRLQLRLIIPRRLSIDGAPFYEYAIQFFAARGDSVRVNQKILQLSQHLPAIIEGEVSRRSFEAFLAFCPNLDQIVIRTAPTAQALEKAA